MSTRVEAAIEEAAGHVAKAASADSLTKIHLEGNAAIVTLLTALLREVADLRAESASQT